MTNPQQCRGDEGHHGEVDTNNNWNTPHGTSKSKCSLRTKNGSHNVGCAIFVFVSFIFDGFFSGRTLISFLIFLGFIIIASVIGRYIKGQKSTFIGICVLIGLFIIGALTINGFLSLLNLKSLWQGNLTFYVLCHCPNFISKKLFQNFRLYMLVKWA